MCVNSTGESGGVACRRLASVCQSLCTFRFADIGLAGVSLEGGVSQRGGVVEMSNRIESEMRLQQINVQN